MSELQHIGACAILFNSDGKILMGRRKNSYQAGKYGLPGGRIELNEPIIETIKRELVEEIGIKLDSLQYVGVVRENQSTYDFIHFVFSGNLGDQTPKLIEPEKCEGWEWMDQNNLPEDLLDGHRAAISLLATGESLVDLVN